MTGVVVAINASRGMVVVRTNLGDYSVIELIGGCDAEVGDQFTGKLRDLGSEVIRNVSQFENMDVYIQGVFGSRSDAIDLIR